MLLKNKVTLQNLLERRKFFQRHSNDPDIGQKCKRKISELDKLILETVVNNDGAYAFNQVYVK